MTTRLPGESWITEIRRMRGAREVFPHCRLYVIQTIAELLAGPAATAGERDLRGFRSQAAALESMAYAASATAMSAYVPLVQRLVSDPSMMVLDNFAALCAAPDSTRPGMTALNAQREATLDALRACKFELADGHRQCPKCKCRKLLVDERQTRGADEETTKFYTCTREGCEFRFR